LLCRASARGGGQNDKAGPGAGFAASL